MSFIELALPIGLMCVILGTRFAIKLREFVEQTFEDPFILPDSNRTQKDAVALIYPFYYDYWRNLSTLFIDENAKYGFGGY